MGLLLLTGTPTGVQAQGGSTGDQVTVNYDILTNLDWAARVSAQAGLGNRRAGLLPPPDRAPESRVLIKPAPVASRAPEPRTPAPTETAEVGPDVTGQADEGTPPVPRTDAPMESPARVAPLVPQPPPPEPVAKSLATSAPAQPPERAVAEPPAPAVPPAEPAAAPAPQPASPQPAAPPTAAPQTAALPPGGQASDLLAPGDLRLLFAADAFELSQAAKRELAALAGRLRQEGNRRIQILSYASAVDENVSRSRRLSLSRALAVRTFLIDKGVPSTRIDVRALGGDAGDGPADRVDVVDARR